MTKEQLLQSTIDYYGVDPENRRCFKDGNCKYSPKTAGKQGLSEGCAIGRHLSPKVQKAFDNFSGNSYSIIDIMAKEEMKKLLPEWMQEMPVGFLSSVQVLHDKSSSWGAKGLSNVGKQRVNRIIEEYKLSMPLLNTD